MDVFGIISFKFLKRKYTYRFPTIYMLFYTVHKNYLNESCMFFELNNISASYIKWSQYSIFCTCAHSVVLWDTVNKQPL